MVAIIGIICAIAIPALLGQRENARQKATQAAAGAVKAELPLWAEQVRKGGGNPTATNAVAAILAMPHFSFTPVNNA